MKGFSARCSTPWVIWRRSAVSLALLLLGGCSAADLYDRRSLADNLASAHGWQARTIATDSFALASWLGPRREQSVLTIYVEGDGFAWATRDRPSSNPTPRQPLALELALQQREGSVAYLARPCQYVAGAELRGCAPAAWTHERFSAAAVAAADQAISVLKRDYRAERLTLVGYSGGGAIAALVAARRDDVDRLVTVAGMLDHARWAEAQHLNPLTGSLNPADEWAGLTDVPQIHYIGAADQVVDGSVASSFRARFANPAHIQIVVLDGFDHRCCWAGAWAQLAAVWAGDDP